MEVKQLMNRKLKAKIVEKYGSQSNFSVIIKKPEALISRVVHYRRELPPDEQRRWASALEEKPERLFQGPGE